MIILLRCRVTSRTATLLDFVSISNPLKEYKTAIITTKLADHFPVYFVHKTRTGVKEPKWKTYREFSDASKTKFTVSLNNTDWEKVFDCKNTQNAYN